MLVVITIVVIALMGPKCTDEMQRTECRSCVSIARSIQEHAVLSNAAVGIRGPAWPRKPVGHPGPGHRVLAGVLTLYRPPRDPGVQDPGVFTSRRSAGPEIPT